MGMLLAVEASGAGDAPVALPPNLGPGGTVVVDNRLSLGSAPENDLVLDSAIPVHCLIFHDRGRYRLLDHSNGGTKINDAPQPLTGQAPVALSIGDSLLIGGVRLTVLGDAQPEPDLAPGADHAEPGADEPELLDPVQMEPSGADYAVRRDTNVSFWDDEEGALFPSQQRASHFDHADPVRVAYEEPRVGRNIIPDNWDTPAALSDAARTDAPQGRPPVTAGGQPAAAPSFSQHPSAARSNETSLLRAFCRGAGIDPADLPQDQDDRNLELAGQLLSAALGGIQSLLHDDNAHGRGIVTETRGRASVLSLPGTSLKALMRGTVPGDLAIADACAGIASEVADLRQRLCEVSEMAIDMLSPVAIDAVADPPSLSQRLRLRGGPDAFRSAFERRYREVSLGIGVLSGRVPRTSRLEGDEPQRRDWP